MYKAKSVYTKLALDTIITAAKKHSLKELKSGAVIQELKDQLACFVSIHLKDGSLRGCIGTINPQEKNLHLEIISNAISASTKDSRFDSLKVSELEDIEVSVDVLSKPYLVERISELDPFKYGVIVTDGGFMRGVLLPDIEGVGTVEKQLEIAKKKAGLENVAIEALKVYAFTSTRFH